MLLGLFAVLAVVLAAVEAALPVIAHEMASPDEAVSPKYVLLVTDGAVQPRELDRAREQAIGLGIRIFVIAVGGSAGTDQPCSRRQCPVRAHQRRNHDHAQRHHDRLVDADQYRGH